MVATINGVKQQLTLEAETVRRLERDAGQLGLSIDDLVIEAVDAFMPPSLATLATQIAEGDDVIDLGTLGITEDDIALNVQSILAEGEIVAPDSHPVRIETISRVYGFDELGWT